MHLVINRLNFKLLSLTCLLIVSGTALAVDSTKINPHDIVSIHSGYNEIHNEAICADKNFGAFSSLQKNILSQNRLWGDNINWLGSTYYCGVVTHHYFKNAFIHEYNDANSPLYVYVLLDRNTKRYLIAKVERSSWSQFISEGKISYMGSLNNISQAKLTLKNYITAQNHN